MNKTSNLPLTKITNSISLVFQTDPRLNKMMDIILMREILGLNRKSVQEMEIV
jgi:hypothetical protein